MYNTVITAELTAYIVTCIFNESARALLQILQAMQEQIDPNVRRCKRRETHTSGRNARFKQCKRGENTLPTTNNKAIF